jgi:TolB-like protein/cytochrome c-type biogenesis protein CcmH/NrfG
LRDFDEGPLLFRFAGQTLDLERRELRRGSDLIPVEPQVFDLLAYLVRNRHRVVSRDDLTDAVWERRVVSESTMNSRINAARRAIGDSGVDQRLIRTIPRKGIRFVAEVTEEQDLPANAGALHLALPAAGPHVVPDRPSIAVLPLTNLSGDPDQEFFADGMTEEIIIALSRVRWFFVIARHSTFAYKNMTSTTKTSRETSASNISCPAASDGRLNRVRISVQLIDCISGSNLWARSYDRAIADVFAVQDEITQTIVGAIESELSRAERERARVRPRENLDAWSTYQHGMFHLYRFSRNDFIEARRLLEQAISADPELGPAYSALAESLYYEVVYGFAQSPQQNREDAIEPAQHAVALDREDAAAHCTLGRIRYFRREYDAAMTELRTALEINPSLALAHYGLGAALVFSGRSSESFPHLETAIRLSPYDPNMGSFLVRMAEAKYLIGDDESAAAFALKAIGQPHFQWSRYAILIAALGQLDRLHEAQRYIREVSRTLPNFSIKYVVEAHPFSADMGFARYYDGLRKARVPESS